MAAKQLLSKLGSAAISFTRVGEGQGGRAGHIPLSFFCVRLAVQPALFAVQIHNNISSVAAPQGRNQDCRPWRQALAA